MAIVQTLFGDILDQLLPKGVRSKTGELNGGITGMLMPDTTKEMMIGQGGLRNLEKAGMPQDISAEDLAMANFDLKSLGSEQFGKATDWLSKGVAIDTNADKTMYEIPDDAVRLLKGKDPAKIKGAIGFSELYKADLLENAYPEISDIKLKFIDEPNSGRAGGFDPIKNELTINREHPYVQQQGLKSTILHEIQHFVQGKEGFTYGESASLRLKEEPDFQAGVQALQKAPQDPMVANDAATFLVNNPKLGFTPANVENAIRALGNDPATDKLQVLTKAFGSKDLADKFLSKAGGYRALRGVLESKEMAEDGYRKAFDKYLKTEGEAWARMTGASAGMNKQERLANLPANRLDVPQADLTPSRFQELKADSLKGVQYSDPFESSIKSTI